MNKNTLIAVLAIAVLVIGGLYFAKPDLFTGDVSGSFTISDKAWKDNNNNGLQDPGEPPAPGIQLELLNAAGSVIATTTTSTSGLYSFPGLAAGKYRVRVVSNVALTLQNVGLDRTKDSNVNPSTKITDEVSVGPSTVTVDIGLAPKSSVTTTPPPGTPTTPPPTHSPTPPGGKTTR